VVVVLSRLLRGRRDGCCLEVELVLFSAALTCSWDLLASTASSDWASWLLPMAGAESQVMIARTG
jgi:hypothetical protein